MRPRKNLLYIGNKLAVHGKNPTAIDRLPAKLEAEGYTVITASSKRTKLLRLWDMIVTTIKNRKRVAMVLIDTYSTQNFYYAVIVASLCRLLALPYIPILHGGNLPIRLKRSKGLSDTLFGKAHINVAPSEYLLHQFMEAGFHNIICIPNAIEIEKYPFKTRPSITPKLLWVRSFSELYNPLMALEIVEMLKRKGMDVSLCMVGPDKDGSLKRCQKIAAELQLPITFTGMLKKKEWIALSKDFDIFINTTNFDNMPLSVMEAMALGMPVVSTNVGGLPFLIENNVNGLLIPPNNPEAFVNAIEAICSNDVMARELAKNARLQTEGFDWEKVKQRWIKLLND